MFAPVGLLSGAFVCKLSLPALKALLRKMRPGADVINKFYTSMAMLRRNKAVIGKNSQAT